MEERERRIAEIVRAALLEDAARKDATTKLLVDAGKVGDAVIRAGAPGIVSGHDAAREAFRALDPAIAYSPAAPDGAPIEAGGTVSRIYGHVRTILSAERTALNFLQHLSGVATLAAAFVARVAGTGVTILDTRKTVPGLRLLEKEAVAHGGGTNHRADLSSMILVKDNHIAVCGGIAEAVRRLGASKLGACEIEVGSLEDLESLRETPPKRVMLDNFTPHEVAEAVARLSAWQRRPEIEVSGGVTLENAAAYAVPGVDFISVGAITSRACALDMSLDLEGADRR